MAQLAVIGGGPAGLSAAVYAARAGISCVIFEGVMYGGQIMNTPEVENYPSIKKISGWELAQNLYEQATDLGAELKFETVTGVEDRGAVKTVHTTEASYDFSAVIIANGAKRRTLGCDGEERLAGAGVSYCAYCDGSFFKGKTALVVGGGNTAVEDALYLANICEKVYLVHRRSEFRAERKLVEAAEAKENIIPVLNSVVTGIYGESVVEGAVVNNVETDSVSAIETDCVFVSIGLAPDNALFEGLVDLDEKGYIRAGEDCLTGRPGFFAAGDTRTKTLRQVVTAAADGAVAAVAAASYINSL